MKQNQVEIKGINTITEKNEFGFAYPSVKSEITMINVTTITGINIRFILTELNQADIFKVKKDFIKKKYKFAQTMPVDE